MFEPDTTLGPLELSPRCPNFAKSFGDLSSTLRGFAVSFLMLTGALPAFFAGQLANQFGHLRVILAGASIFSVGCALQGGAMGLSDLLVGRGLAGLGLGLWLTNIST